MANNYTTSELSQVPYPENAQFQQIKGLTGGLVFLMVSFALIILKYIKMNALKILESKDVEKNVITELTKLHDRVELLSYRQKKTSFQPDYKKSTNLIRTSARLANLKTNVRTMSSIQENEWRSCFRHIFK